MRADEIRNHLRRQPFRPFRLYLSNGVSHDVRHPEMAIVGRNVVALGVQTNDNDLPRIRLVSVSHINEVETIVPERKSSGKR